MTIKRLATAGVFALAALVNMPAQAALFDLGELNSTNYSADFSNKPTGVFTDTYLFSLSQDAVVGASLTNVSLFGVNSITGFAATLDSQPLTLEVDDKGVVTVSLLYGDAVTSTGSHSLVVSGAAPGTGATYGGNITVAVPEPETYALILAGLGVVGFVGRRRRVE
jgi:PEP-CTERM motif